MVKRLWIEKSVKLQAIGRRNGSPLIGNAKGEEIVYSHLNWMCSQYGVIRLAILLEYKEKAPIYTLGSPEPRSFSRGKRGIAGTLVFTMFNRDALLEEFKAHNQMNKLQKFKGNVSSTDIGGYTPYTSIDEWDRAMTNGTYSNDGSSTVQTTGDLVDKNADAAYADEILPFDITITFANEYGQNAVATIYGVELLNEGSGFSIDTVSAEKAYTFIARRISYMKKDDGTTELSNSHKLSGASYAE